MNLQAFSGVLAPIQAAIEDLGGAVTPKLNWSCPKDAIWVTLENSHKCRNAEEVHDRHTLTLIACRALVNRPHVVIEASSIPPEECSC